MPSRTARTTRTTRTIIFNASVDTNSSRGLLAFCGTMLYQMERVKLNGSFGVAAGVITYFNWSGFYLFVIITLSTQSA